MFIKYGERRINLNAVVEYKPLQEKNFFISIKYITGERESLHFFDRKKERDNFIKELDDLCLKKLNSGT